MAQALSLKSHFDYEDKDAVRNENQKVAVPAAKLISMAVSFQKKEHSWCAISQIPTDLAVQVENITFDVHKYPLVSRSGYIARKELQSSTPAMVNELKLENFPGGSETFEIILKFCYDLPLCFNTSNIAALRCGSEFMEMTDELEEGNLISKTEAFISLVVLTSCKDSITVLKSCETLSPWAEDLQVVRRCCDSIVHRAFQESLTTSEINNDVITLRIDHFMRIVTGMKLKGLKQELLGQYIVKYAEKWLPRNLDQEGVEEKNELQWCILRGKRQEGGIRQNKEQRTIIESLVSILPLQKEVVPCKFLLWMLKLAIVYAASPALISELEKRIGMALESITADDLLIPSCTTGDQGKQVNSTEEHTTYNVDAVRRILEYFLMYEQQQQIHIHEKSNISKLIDNYLAEIAGDPNLSVMKFQVIAESLPENARTCDDGLYRAIDIYLKTHPSLSESDRRRLCKVMDYQKLSLDACAHAAQNDRLPLRTTIQVLFSEQQKLRTAMQEKGETINGDKSDLEDILSSAKKEIEILKTELDKMREKVSELQADYLELQENHERLHQKQRKTSGWTSGWRKITKSVLFNGKLDVDENSRSQERSTPVRSRPRLIRRQSIS